MRVTVQIRGTGFGGRSRRTRVCVGERDQLGRRHARCPRIIRHDAGDDGQRTSQCVQSTALIMQVEDAVMMIGIGSRRGNVDMMMIGDRGRLVDVERMLIHQRRHASDLGKREQPDKSGSRPADRPRERHVHLPPRPTGPDPSYTGSRGSRVAEMSQRGFFGSCSGHGRNESTAGFWSSRATANSFSNGHEQSLGMSVGLLIAIQ